MLAPEDETIDYKTILHYVGGIVFNFATLLISIACLFFIPNEAIYFKQFVLILSGISFYIIFLNFIPEFKHEDPYDGNIVWGLILKNNFSESWLRFENTASKLYVGVRPKDLTLPELSNTQEYRTPELMMVLYSYYKVLDSDNFHELKKHCDIFEKNIDAFPPSFLAPVYYELLFYGCISDNMEMVKTYYPQIEEILKEDNDANGLRVKAYYEYYINKDINAAKVFCEQALAVADKFPIKGQAIMERELVERLMGLIDNSYLINPEGPDYENN